MHAPIIVAGAIAEIHSVGLEVRSQRLAQKRNKRIEFFVLVMVTSTELLYSTWVLLVKR